MVKKLFKHELQYYLRSLLPFYMILGGVALIGRFIEFFEAETVAYTILRSSSVLMLAVACMATIGLTMIFSVVRFYKNLFTGEGYLTLTLPVTVRAHILTKLCAAVIANAASYLAVVLAVCVFTVGPWLVELVKAAEYIWKDVAANFNGHFGWYVVEYIPLALVQLCQQLMLYYMCICIGQLAKKNRVIAAIGAYFGIYVINQIASTILTILVSLGSVTEWFARLVEGMTKQAIFGYIHGGIWVMFAFGAALTLIYYAVCKYIMRKRLNLE